MKKTDKSPKNLFVVRICTKGPNKKGYYVAKAREVTKKGVNHREREIHIKEKVSKGDLIQITKNGAKVVKGKI